MVVFANGIEFHGFHGVFEHEREKGNNFICNVEVVLEQAEPASDDLKATLNYDLLCQAVVVSNTSKKFLTVEALAIDIAQRVFPLDFRIFSVSVTLEKLNPPTSLPCQSAGVRLTVHRDSVQPS